MAASRLPSGLRTRRPSNLSSPSFSVPATWAGPSPKVSGPPTTPFCAGSGAGGGTPRNTDGIFFVNSETTPGKITDGLSKTALASESLLGQPQPTSPHDPQLEYKFIFSAPVSEAICNATAQWNISDPRGFAWVNGEYRCGLYNHHDGPNATVPDCMGVQIGGGVKFIYTPYGWRAARSNHPGGVNVLLADGSLHFISDAIDAEPWKALATIAGGETASLP